MKLSDEFCQNAGEKVSAILTVTPCSIRSYHCSGTMTDEWHANVIQTDKSLLHNVMLIS